jgi:uncharacterized membrane protein
MEKRTTLLMAAVGGLMAVSQLALQAQPPAPSPGFAAERCFGVARAGKNDCAANGHACQGQAKRDHNPREWLFLPAGTCERIVGGSLTAK